MSIIVVLPRFWVPSVNKSDFFVLTVAETSLDMKQSSQRAACVFASRDITRIQSNTTIETHTFAPEPYLPSAVVFRVGSSVGPLQAKSYLGG